MDIHFVIYQSNIICQSPEVTRDCLVTFTTLLLKQFVDYCYAIFVQTTCFYDLDIFYVGEELLDQRNLDLNIENCPYKSHVMQTIKTNCGYLNENEILSYFQYFM